MKKKLRRYHVDFFVPAWGREESRKFIMGIAGRPMGYSKHAIKKSAKLSRKIKRFIRNIMTKFGNGDELLLDYLFEFYADENNRIRKSCYRFPIKEIDTDIIMVMSYKGTVVTIYINNKFNKHKALNKNLYEKEQ